MVLFCVPINIYSLFGTYTVAAKWCGKLTQSSLLTINSILYLESVKIQYTYAFTVSYTLYGWQYVGFLFHSSSGTFTGSATVTAYLYDSSGTYTSYTLTAQPSSPDTSTILSTFGRLQIGTSIYNPMDGLISLIEICDSTSSCPTTSITTRSSFATYQMNLYENYWDLTQGTTFINYLSNNPCLRRQELGLSDIYFTYDNNVPPPYPTGRGWFVLNKNTNVYANGVDFSYSHQLTFEIEIFPIDPNFSFTFYPYEDWNNHNRMYIEFKKSGTYTYNPYSYSSGVALTAQKWNKVFISICTLDTSDKIRISIFKSVLNKSTDSGGTITSYSTSNSTSQYMLKGTKMNIKFMNSKSIIKSLKYYKWAFNIKSIQDKFMYSYPDDIMYTFQTNSVNNYFYYFNYWKSPVVNSSNACMSYATSDLNVCADLSTSTAGCTTGYELVTDFCVDKCADGSVQLNPQMAQCDDGNTINGDGCTKDCYVETYYTCDVKTELNNKSYCYLTCGDGRVEASSTEACDDGNYVNGDGCKSDCSVESGFKCNNFSYKPSFCYPRCGDGVRDNTPPVEECDDGNNFDTDGCSKTCKVEFNYACNPGSTGADVCATIYPAPKVTGSKFDPTLSQITINFDQIMLDQNMTGIDINLDASGQNSPYSISYTTNFTNNQFIVSMIVTPIFLGGIGETVLLQLLTTTKFKSEHLIPMSIPQEFKFTVPSLTASDSVQSGGSSASYMFIITMLVSLGISILTGGSMELMWSLANTLQMLYFFGMLDLYFPSDLNSVYEFLKYSNFDNPATDYIKELSISLIQYANSPVNTSFSNFGFGSTDILANCLSKILLVMIILIITILLGVIAYKCKDRDSKIIKFIKKQDKKLRYESFSRFIIELVLNFSIASMINIVYGNKNGALNIIGLVVACITLLGLFILLVYLFLYPFIYFEDIKIDPECHERHAFIFSQFKSNNIKCMFYFAYFVLRRLLFSLVLVCMHLFIIHQCILILLLCLWIFLYQAILRPYKSCLNNFIGCFNEGILLAYSSLMFIFIDPSQPSKLKISGYMCIALILAFISLNWAIIFPVMTYSLYVKMKVIIGKVLNKLTGKGTKNINQIEADKVIQEANTGQINQDTQDKILMGSQRKGEASDCKQYLVEAEVEWGPDKFTPMHFEENKEENFTARFNQSN